MKKKVIIFVDGNNWYHNTKKIIDTKEIDFIKLADFITNKFDLELKQIRYYNSIPDISENPLVYHKHMEFLTNLEQQGIKVFKRKLQKTSNKEVIKQKQKMLERIDLCKTCFPLVKLNCFACVGNTSKKEKGVDVKIAVDMVRKCLIEEECDTCILISGDADFIPSIQTIKDAKKEVITISVYPGFSRELRSGKFRYLILKEDDLNKNCMKDYKK